ncbi:YggT family protein [Candidatus Saccharibacteria bacterium]|nr:YggT family protein [Candidatus Saccharibacteria bacterium]
MAQIYPKVHHDVPVYRDHTLDTDDTEIRLSDDNPGITRSQQVIQLVIGLFSSLLLLRFLLALFGANASNTLVNFVYGVTAPLVSPFRGLFNLSPTAGVSRFEVETLVATIVYILVGVGIIRMLDVFRHHD